MYTCISIGRCIRDESKEIIKNMAHVSSVQGCKRMQYVYVQMLPRALFNGKENAHVARSKGNKSRCNNLLAPLPAYFQNQKFKPATRWMLDLIYLILWKCYGNLRVRRNGTMRGFWEYYTIVQSRVVKATLKIDVGFRINGNIILENKLVITIVVNLKS